MSYSRFDDGADRGRNGELARRHPASSAVPIPSQLPNPRSAPTTSRPRLARRENSRENIKDYVTIMRTPPFYRSHLLRLDNEYLQQYRVGQKRATDSSP